MTSGSREGFARFSEWMYNERTGGLTAQQQFDAATTTGCRRRTPRWQGPPALIPDGASLFSPSFVPYNRGAMTLQALRVKIGDAVFFPMMRKWYADNRNGNVTTEDFMALAESESGQQLDAFFDVWLVHAGKADQLVVSPSRQKSPVRPWAPRIRWDSSAPRGRHASGRDESRAPAARPHDRPPPPTDRRSRVAGVADVAQGGTARYRRAGARLDEVGADALQGAGRRVQDPRGTVTAAGGASTRAARRARPRLRDERVGCAANGTRCGSGRPSSTRRPGRSARAREVLAFGRPGEQGDAG